jgi:hypothetical protein
MVLDYENMTSIVEKCQFHMYLKEDGHLAVLCMAGVCLFLNTLGVFLLFLGITTSSYKNKFYFYHSAGECLLTSGIFNGGSIFSFILLTTSQIDPPFSYGFCPVLNLCFAFVDFIIGFILFVDEIVNEVKLNQFHLKQREDERLNRIKDV